MDASKPSPVGVHDMIAYGFADNANHRFDCASVFRPFLYLQDRSWTSSLKDGKVNSLVQGQSDRKSTRLNSSHSSPSRMPSSA